LTESSDDAVPGTTLLASTWSQGLSIHRVSLDSSLDENNNLVTDNATNPLAQSSLTYVAATRPRRASDADLPHHRKTHFLTKRTIAGFENATRRAAYFL
jgi:hypothetical protein